MERMPDDNLLDKEAREIGLLAERYKRRHVKAKTQSARWID